MIEYKVVVDDDGNRRWFHNGQRHREDGPAIEYANGDKKWYRNGELHREDGPAVECANGNRRWYRSGQRHREDGPAVERRSGNHRWFIDGKEIPEPDAPQELTVAEIEQLLGYSVKVVK